MTSQIFTLLDLFVHEELSGFAGRLVCLLMLSFKVDERTVRLKYLVVKQMRWQDYNFAHLITQVSLNPELSVVDHQEKSLKKYFSFYGIIEGMLN